MARLIELVIALMIMFAFTVVVLTIVVGAPIILCAGVWSWICLLGHIPFSWDIPVTIGLFLVLTIMMCET